MVIKPVPVDINDIVCRTVFTFEKAIVGKALGYPRLGCG